MNVKWGILHIDTVTIANWKQMLGHYNKANHWSAVFYSGFCDCVLSTLRAAAWFADALPQEVVACLACVLNLFYLVFCVQSVFLIHKGMTNWFFPLLQLLIINASRIYKKINIGVLFINQILKVLSFIKDVYLVQRYEIHFTIVT